ncbi:unnamed protein product [Caenorhabditis angaria]|uniref:Uncharacterized protein n=1 Tax=Caenorhabditis angaria TaxID=860376 RepID=A0A9P1N4T3_9PELO|nr:unnamed protein product [Caenorhabditis angaria]
MQSFVIVACCLATVISAAAVQKKTPEVKPEAGAAYGVPVQQTQPQYVQYVPQQFPVFNFPNFDVNYCSVHASFPLVGLNNHRRRRGPGGPRVKRQTYGVPSTTAQDQTQTNTQNVVYVQQPQPQYLAPGAFQRPRPFERQGCSNTAIFSQKACHACCSVASRAAGNNNPTVGILLAFDPQLSVDRKHHKDNKDADLNEPDRAVQCVCCTSRQV